MNFFSKNILKIFPKNSHLNWRQWLQLAWLHLYIFIQSLVFYFGIWKCQDNFTFMVNLWNRKINGWRVCFKVASCNFIFKPWGNITCIKILHYMHETKYFCGVFCEGTFLSPHILLLFDVHVFKANIILFFICIKFE